MTSDLLARSWRRSPASRRRSRRRAAAARLAATTFSRDTLLHIRLVGYESLAAARSSGPRLDSGEVLCVALPGPSACLDVPPRRVLGPTRCADRLPPSGPLPSSSSSERHSVSADPVGGCAGGSCIDDYDDGDEAAVFCIAERFAVEAILQVGYDDDEERRVAEFVRGVLDAKRCGAAAPAAECDLRRDVLVMVMSLVDEEPTSPDMVVFQAWWSGRPAEPRATLAA